MSASSSKSKSLISISAQDPGIVYQGRVVTKGGSPRLIWTGASMTLQVQADSIWVELESFNPRGDAHPMPDSLYLSVLVEGKRIGILTVPPGRSILPLPLTAKDRLTRLSLFKNTEAHIGAIAVKRLLLSPEGQIGPPPELLKRRVEFIGNSITCGYGNLGDDQYCRYSNQTEDGFLTYARLTAQALGAEFQAVCFSGKGIYLNYDRTQEENLLALYPLDAPGGKPYNFEDPSPDAVFINLGTNDFSQATPPRAAFIEHYLDLIRKIKEQHPQAHIFCLTGPMLNDQAERQPLNTLKNYLGDIVSQASSEKLGPIDTFHLTPQGALGFGCDWHPNLAQHKMNAEELSDFGRQKLKW
ncbi:MAG: GDSL-type esterase/lipase family protein [Bacteroidota bacterium]